MLHSLCVYMCCSGEKFKENTLKQKMFNDIYIIMTVSERKQAVTVQPRKQLCNKVIFLWIVGKMWENVGRVKAEAAMDYSYLFKPNGMFLIFLNVSVWGDDRF